MTWTVSSSDDHSTIKASTLWIPKSFPNLPHIPVSTALMAPSGRGPISVFNWPFGEGEDEQG